MSRGPGHIERAILAALAAEPDNAFTVLDLVDRIWPERSLPWSRDGDEVVENPNRAEKKHRVAVARAMRSVVARAKGDLAIFDYGGHGSARMALYRSYDVMSYAMARLKNDFCSVYRPDHVRALRYDPFENSEADLRAELAPGGRQHRLIVPGGVWFQHVALAIAKRDGDTAAVAALEAEAAAWLDGTAARVRAAMERTGAGVST